jgi:hypothetical protein
LSVSIPVPQLINRFGKPLGDIFQSGFFLLVGFGHQPKQQLVTIAIEAPFVAPAA